MTRSRRHPDYTTRWEGDDIVLRDRDVEIDRIGAAEIHRIILVNNRDDAPSNLRYVVLETAADHVLLPAETGIAGPVHFERQAFWQQRGCVFWADAARASLPRHLQPGLWLLRRNRPGYMRLPVAELAPVIERWNLEGPQTWEQRKWARIAAQQGLGPPGGAPRK